MVIINQALTHSLSQLFYNTPEGGADGFEHFQDFVFGKKF